MKICTITCNNAINHGARLQTYALYKYLTDLGHDVKVIDYAPDYIRFSVSSIYNPGVNPKEWAKLVLHLRRRLRAIRQHRKMEEFSRKYIGLTGEYSSLDELRSFPPEADLYIAGSDQIWNTIFRQASDPAFYLGFGDEKTRRISYAASISTESVPEEYREMMTEQLKRFDALSVRENSAVDILRGMGYDSRRVCDPALLLDADKWEEVIEDNAGAGEKYLLIYDFEGGSELRQVARRIARLRGLKIYSASLRFIPYAHKNFLDCSPSTFVALIKNASCVLSNSLHGTIFSLIFNKDFYIVKRTDGLNLRMVEITKSLKLDDRMVTAEAPDEVLSSHIDYAQVAPLVNKSIEASRQWLENNMRT